MTSRVKEVEVSKPFTSVIPETRRAH